MSAAGCGLGPNHTLNTKSLDSQIAGQLKSRYPVSSVRVTCPGSIKEKSGTKFSCSASLGSQKVTLNGTVTSSSGRYNIQPADAIVISSDAATTIQQQIASQLQETVSVVCSPPLLRVVAPGGQFSCTATLAGQTTRQVTVTVLDASGHTRFSLNTGG